MLRISNNKSYNIISSGGQLSTTASTVAVQRILYGGTHDDTAQTISVSQSIVQSDTLGANKNVSLSFSSLYNASALSGDNTNLKAYSCDLNQNSVTGANSTVFNYSATGTAPNFFQGSTYIGGNTTRNTIELWKSTLTEEQLEQLRSWNVIPQLMSLCLVTVVCRQWWYDQQSAEDQALIDKVGWSIPST